MTANQKDPYAISDEVLAGRVRSRELYSTAPTQARIREARVTLTVWGALMGAITLLLVSLVGFRVFELALPIGFGPGFAIGLAVLVALSFIGAALLIVTWASKGSLMGERLRLFRAAVQDAEDQSDALQDDATELVRDAQVHGADASGILDRADDIKTRIMASLMEAIYTAASVLGVAEVAAPRRSRLLSIESKTRTTTDTMLAEAPKTASSILQDASKRVLPTIKLAPNAHRDVHTPWLANVDLTELDPETLPFTRVPEPAPRRRVWPWILAAFLVVTLVAGVLIAWQFVAGAADAAPAAPPATPTAPSAEPTGDAVEGVDYAFIATSTSGDPDRWSCDQPIGVGIVGDAPEGADAVVAGAVSVLRDGSGLPISVVDGSAAQITVRYASHDEIAGAGGDSDAIGVASPSFDTLTGSISSAEILLDRDAAANDPSAPVSEWPALHELLHSVGAGHATDETELMAPVLSAQNEGLGNGDVAVMHLVGCS